MKNNYLFLCCIIFLGFSVVNAQQIYTNGSFSTGTTSKSGAIAPTGYTWSELQNDTGNTTESNGNLAFGCSFNNAGTSNNVLADDFVVPAGAVWNVTSFEFFAYRAGNTSTTVPFDQLRIQIYNGDPTAGGTIVAGNLTDNVLDAQNSTEAMVYRIFNSSVPSTSNPPGTTRKVWKLRGNISVSLSPGTYWVVYQAHASDDGLAFSPLVTVTGSRTVAGYNAKYANSIPLTPYYSLIDVGNPNTAPDVAVDIPFNILSGPAPITAPLSLTGFNADVVANGADFSSSTTNDFDGGGARLIASDYTQYGTPAKYLPNGGNFTSLNTSDVSYRFASYTANNSLRLTDGQSGELTIGTATTATKLYILGASGNGNSTATFTVTFSDNSAQVFTNQTINDWYNGANFAIKGIGRVYQNSLDANSNADNPRLYETILTLDPANHLKTITKIQVLNTNTSSTKVLNIMAVTAGFTINKNLSFTGFNADVVANGTSFSSSTTNDFDGGGARLIASDYTQYGTPAKYLPNGGNFTSLNTNDISYQFASYTANNSLRLTDGQSGELTLSNATTATKLYILGASGNGNSTATFTVTFSDNSTQVFANQTINDWYNGVNFAIKGIGRVFGTSLDANSNADNPRLYETILTLDPANHLKSITKIQVLNTNTSSTKVLNIMAITARFTPVNTNTFNTASSTHIVTSGAVTINYNGGTLTNNGTFTNDAGTLVFSSPVTVAGTNAISTKNLTVTHIGISKLDNRIVITGSLAVNNGTLNANNKLTLISNETSSAVIAPVASGSSITGKVTVQRYIAQGKRAFRFLTPSVTTDDFISNNWQLATHITGSTTGANGFDATGTGNPSLFTYNNQQAGGTGWTPIATTNATNLEATKGYRLLVRGDRNVNINAASVANMNNSVTLTATGTVATGTIALNTSSNPAINNTNNTTTNGYSLIGNPYVNTINWNTITKSGLTDAYYAWDANMGTAAQRGRYVAYNTTTGSNNIASAVNQFIQPGQAFFVKNNTLGIAGSITFNETDKLGTNVNPSFFRTSETALARLDLQVFGTIEMALSTNPIDATVAVFGSEFSNQLETGDVEKLTTGAENLSFFNGATSLAIDARPNVTATDQLAVQLQEFQANKSYTFRTQFSNFDAGITPFLWDTYLSLYSPLALDTPTNVTFTTSADAASYDTNRFKIVFQNTTLNNPDFFADQIILFPNPVTNGQFNIILPNNLTGSVNIKIINLLGQTVYHTTTAVQNNSTVNIGKSLPQAVYTVKIENQGNSVTKKITVK